MKHKVGDTVRIKSREWWDAQPKNEKGNVIIGGVCFVEDMTEYCHKLATITYILHGLYLVDVDDNNWTWNDEMFEEDVMDAKTEALEAVRRAEEELARAKKLLEQVEKDQRVGKLCKVWDGVEPNIEECGVLVVTDVVQESYSPIQTTLCEWEHARLLTEEEKAKYL